jgi:hypothetical protein
MQCFFSATLTRYLLLLDLLLLVCSLWTCVCRLGLNPPHKTEKKNKTLVINPSGGEHQNPSDDDDVVMMMVMSTMSRYLFSFGKSHMTNLFVGLAYLLPRQG